MVTQLNQVMSKTCLIYICFKSITVSAVSRLVALYAMQSCSPVTVTNDRSTNLFLLPGTMPLFLAIMAYPLRFPRYPAQPLG
jgi:hypothetical protein